MQIQFAHLQEEVTAIDDYYWRYDNRAGNTLQRWLSKLAWSFLQSIKAVGPKQIEIRQYTFTEQNELDALKLIEDQLMEVVCREKSLEDWCIIIGAKQFHEMTGALYKQGFHTFNLKGSNQFVTPGGYVTTFKGVPIHVIAGVDGAAMIPKVIVEKPSQ